MTETPLMTVGPWNLTTYQDPAYGRRTIVRFYDARQREGRFAERGQYVSEYFVGTLTCQADGLIAGGLCLHGGVPEWNVSGEHMATILARLRELS